MTGLRRELRPNRMNRYPRRLRNLVRHSTPRRLFNLLLVELELKLGRTKLRGRPYIAFVDPINVCNLRCPLCPTGTNDLLRQRGSMDPHLFEHTVDEIAPWAYELTLYNWGEPLLHKDIFEMIRYASDRNLATSISSNFNLLRDGDLDRLIDSGLEYLTVSIDGASAETYGRYRVRGNFDTVLGNLRALVWRRRERGAPNPVIEWQFIVMRHNEHEIERARELAAEIGVDLVSFVPVALPFDTDPQQRATLAAEWFSSLPGFRHADAAAGWTVTKGPWRRWFSWGRRYRDIEWNDSSARRGPGAWPARCYHLYRSITVNPDGGVAPCCIVYDERADTGNIRAGVHTLWNNEIYQSSRAEFSARATPARETICSRCTIFAKPERRRDSAPLPLVSPTSAPALAATVTPERPAARLPTGGSAGEGDR